MAKLGGMVVILALHVFCVCVCDFEQEIKDDSFVVLFLLLIATYTCDCTVQSIEFKHPRMYGV